ncbi:MAG TPA: hypothetical protein VIN39_07190 [Candidatus Dormibacteraeota bacterium]|jgi:hypothetical protein
MFRWMVFFLLIVLGIVTFVAFVLGVPIPGLSQSGYQPSSPFSP